MPTSHRQCQHTKHHLNQVLIALVCMLIVAGCVPSAANAKVYTVQPGDTLAKIAAANDTTVEKLVELNQETYPSLASNPGAIEVGWEIRLPGSSKSIAHTTKRPPSTSTAKSPEPTAFDRDTFEAEIVTLVNTERDKAGLAPLQIDPDLMQSARERSQDMIDRGYFSHYDPDTGEAIAHRWNAAENISHFELRFQVVPPNLAPRITSSWMESEGHRANILKSEAHRTGVGVATDDTQIIVTQLFGK